MSVKDATGQIDASTEVQDLRRQIEELEHQLLQSQKMGTIGELSASITHEFNNILTTVINYAKLGLRHQDAANRDKAFNKILSAGQRAAKITTGMLSYVRDRGSRREPFSLKRLLDDVLVLVEKDLQVNRISLDLQVTDDPHALVNPNEVQQVLLNLIVNARQAMQPGGSLTITIVENQADQWAEISVADTGSGIPADQLSQIFKRFYTTKTADRQGQGGTGLGLALCKNIVDAHQGRIRVESAVGHGTKFTLKFPLATAASLTAFSESHDSSQGSQCENRNAPTPA